jgi:HSP20 family protein
MATTRYYVTPWRELQELGGRLARRGNGFGAAPHLAWTGNGPWSPPVGIEETRDALVLTAELPGVAAEELEIQLENNVLTIRGEKRAARTEDAEAGRYHLWERSHGSFARAFTLPAGVRSEAITAGLDNGVLRVELPKLPEARTRRIPVNGNGGAAPEAGQPAE